MAWVRSEDRVAWWGRGECQENWGVVKVRDLAAMALRQALAFTPRSMFASHSTRHLVLEYPRALVLSLGPPQSGQY